LIVRGLALVGALNGKSMELRKHFLLGIFKTQDLVFTLSFPL